MSDVLDSPDDCAPASDTEAAERFSPSSQTIYIARQPIVDAKMDLVGFELLFRSTAENVAIVDDSVFATSTVVAHAFAEIGLAQVVGPVDGYLNVDTEFLYSDLIDALPPDRIVLELLEQRIVDEAVIERCRELRKRGYRIALDDFVGNFDELDKLLPSVDVVKIDFQRIDPLLVPMIVKMLRRFSVKLIAARSPRSWRCCGCCRSRWTTPRSARSRASSSGTRICRSTCFVSSIRRPWVARRA